MSAAVGASGGDAPTWTQVSHRTMGPSTDPSPVGDAGDGNAAAPRHHVALMAKRAALLSTAQKAIPTATLIPVLISVPRPSLATAPALERRDAARTVRVLFNAWRLEGG